MKLRLLAATLAALTLSAGAALAQDTTSAKGQLSYALGYQLGRSAAESGESIDLATMSRALQDGFSKKEPAVPVEQMRTAYQGMQQRLQAKEKASFEKAAAENKTKSDAFIAQNRTRPGVQVLANGAQYRILEVGNGAKPTQASKVDLEVAGPFPWGQRPTKVQSPQKLPGMKISEIEMPAMREALLQMPSGSKWEITLPADKAYGADPRTPFPPNIAVVFEVKLASVK